MLSLLSQKALHTCYREQFYPQETKVLHNENSANNDTLSLSSSSLYDTCALYSVSFQARFLPLIRCISIVRNLYRSFQHDSQNTSPAGVILIPSSPQILHQIFSGICFTRVAEQNDDCFVHIVH